MTPLALDSEKKHINDLACLGGAPAFQKLLHVGRPNIGDRQKLMERINDVLDRQWLSNYGPLVQEFEKRIAEMLGVRHCIAMCNGTVALEIAIRSLDLKGEVIVPSYTFIATAHALQWQEITPVFCDIDPRTHSLDPARIESMITPRTTGIIGVHLWGRPCDVEAIEQIATRRKLKVIYDASHAFGCAHQGRMIGSFGNAEVFSFHATKFFNTLEGGAIVTDDDDLAARIRLMKNFGFKGYDNVIYLGTNGKMNEISAAMGLTGLDALDSFLDVNRCNYEAYSKGLESIPGVQLFRYDSKDRTNHQYIVLEIDEQRCGISRDALVSIFHAENVIARKYFWPGCHRMEPYRSLFPHAGLLLPETERVANRVMILPTGTAISVDDIHLICNILRTVIENGPAVSHALAARTAS